MSPAAITRLARYFATLRTRPGILARRVLGTPDPSDPRLAGELGAALAGDSGPMAA